MILGLSLGNRQVKSEMNTMIGVIGGSGLYEIDGLQGASWKSVESPWGVPSDQILTGRLPYDVDTTSSFDVPRIIRECEPARLSSVAPACRGDVETSSSSGRP